MKCPYCGEVLTDETICPRCRAELPKKKDNKEEK